MQKEKKIVKGYVTSAKKKIEKCFQKWFRYTLHAYKAACVEIAQHHQ